MCLSQSEEVKSETWGSLELMHKLYFMGWTRPALADDVILSNASLSEGPDCADSKFNSLYS